MKRAMYLNGLFETTTLMDVFPNIQYRESLQFKRASKKTF